jgi:hypothetical protein
MSFRSFRRRESGHARGLEEGGCIIGSAEKCCKRFPAYCIGSNFFVFQ